MKDITLHDIPNTPLLYLWYISQYNRATILIAFLGSIVGGIVQNVMPYISKILVNAASLAATGSLRTVWIWGGVYILFYFVSEYMYRVSGFVGLTAVARTKANSYNLLLRFLAMSTYNDEPGAVVHRTVLISEGSNLFLQGVIWNDARTVLRIIISIILAFNAHPFLFFVCVGWMVTHVISSYFIMKFKTRFTKLLAQATSALQGEFVSFCRVRMYTPDKIITQLSEEVYKLNQVVNDRKERHLLDLRISESIYFLYSTMHGIFIALIIIGVLVLWQDRLISPGDIAMILSVVINVRQALTQYTESAIRIGACWAEIDAGLEYLHKVNPKALQAPKGVF